MGRIAIVALAALALLVPNLSEAALAQDQSPPQQVDGPEISTLIRTTLIALDQANVTGNYTVLRDLGASVLRAANTAADLAARFAVFRQKRISLAPAVLIDAVLDEKPKLSTNGVLRLVGHFPTKPQEIVFDLTFLYEGGDWRIAQISVATRVPAATDAGSAKPGASSGPLPSAQVPTPRLPPTQ